MNTFWKSTPRHAKQDIGGSQKNAQGPDKLKHRISKHSIVSKTF
jgi:hypothetical protein